MIEATTTEIVIESSKVFLQSIVKPVLDEVGGLLADQVKFWRFKNQIKMLEQSETLLKDKGIKIKETPIKLLVPLLEGAGMEEDEDMQDKWARLFANTVKENSEIETTIYSYILSQMTSADAEVMNYFYNERLSPLHLKDLVELDNRNAIIVDNLMRLRLIKDLKTHSLTANVFIISDLGVSFMKVCSEVN